MLATQSLLYHASPQMVKKSCPARGQPSNRWQLLCKCCTLQDAGPGQESVKCERLCEPHRTGRQQEQRLFTWIIASDRTSVWEGTENFPKCPKCGTHLPIGSRLKTFGNLGSLGGWTLGDTNVEGGLHYPFPVKTRLDNVTKNYQLLCTSSPGPRLVRDINTSAYGQGAVEPVQNLWASSTFLGTKSTHCWRPILGLSNPNL